ncbi:hypothetical protein ACR77J_12255 [Tissierella praeacuta]|uniref:hypothetical protein n=1 Tax=Tissierella praeacuta TaxID=43131 RepID=UPI003DA50E63
MNLENSIKDVIAKKLEDGTVEKLIAEELEKGIQKSLEELFGWRGDASKVIEEKIKSVMVPYLENYDYSKYILKLDAVLVEILQNTTLDNKEMLENFKDLMLPEERKIIKATEIFKEWQKKVAKDVDTSDLEINYDDEVSYQDVDVSLTFEELDKGYSIYDRAKLVFECEDEDMNCEVRLKRWENDRDKNWDIEYEGVHSIASVRYLEKFQIFLMRLSQAGVKVEIDSKYEEDWVEVEAEPEASFS